MKYRFSTGVPFHNRNYGCKHTNLIKNQKEETEDSPEVRKEDFMENGEIRQK